MEKSIQIEGPFGTIRHALDTSTHKYLEIEHGRSSSVPIHSHETAHFMFVMKGVYQSEMRGGCFNWGPMSMLFHPSGITHRDHFISSGGSLFYISLKLSDIEFSNRFENVMQERTLKFSDEEIKWLGTRMICELRNKDQMSPYILNGMTNELLARVVRKRITVEKKYPKWLGQIREFINDQYAEPITAVDLGEIAGVNPLHLSRTFRRFFRCTPSEYVRRCRVNNAARMLVDSRLPLVEIALINGFTDQSQFTKTFKKCTNLTPGQYRKIYS